MAGLKTARRILVSNSIAIAMLLLTQIVFASLAKSTKTQSYIYMAIVTMMLVSAISSTLLVKKSIPFAMQLYTWSGLLCVVTMVIIDALTLPDSFPVILFTLHLGIWSLGMTVGLNALIPFTAVSVVVLLIAGLVYNSVDSAIVAIFLAIVAGSPALEVRRLSKELDRVCTAIRIWTNGRDEPDSNTGVN